MVHHYNVTTSERQKKMNSSKQAVEAKMV